VLNPKTMKILFLHGRHSIDDGVTFLKNAGHEVINPALDDKDFDPAVRTAQREYDQHDPDVIVGSSRGGAVAMNINSNDTPLVLLCPAWKNWGSATTIKPNSVILHSRKDDVIPFADSEELINNSCLPPETLIEVGNDHQLADLEPLKAMVLHVKALMQPASFAEKFPRAFHVFPLHALKTIWATGKLLSKKDLRRGGFSMRRNSTCDVDEALGLSHFIHLYLPKADGFQIESLPILETQLRPSEVPPFPHVVMQVETTELVDWQCGICNFNAAVSRPAYGHVRGGNHTRGMQPKDILKHWHGFRADDPDRARMRHSYWHNGISVPLLLRSQITDAPNRVGSKTKTPELLLFSPFALTQSIQFHVFSQADSDSVNICSENIRVNYHKCKQFKWYRERDRVSPDVRKSIDQYFLNEDEPMPNLNYDQLRPAANH
jgi:hypothetical protein